ncbi:MAG: DNA repair protein RadC [Bacteroidales bacterium]|nr:DNA repair protein RadC [Bacteroidales bacterium]
MRDDHLPDDQHKRLTIKDLAADDRPREKLLLKGVAALSDAELLAILLRSGNADSTAVEVAQQMLGLAHNNLNELGRLSVHQLTRLKGVGQTKAVTVLAALELGRRRGATSAMERPSIRSSADALTLMRPKLADLPHEEFWVLLLNRAGGVLGTERVSQGGVSGTVVDVRLVLRPAMEKLAASIILAHNHPSGSPSPSPEDRSITQRVSEAAALLDIKLLDHIIVTCGQCLSFADEGLL